MGTLTPSPQRDSRLQRLRAACLLGGWVLSLVWATTVRGQDQSILVRLGRIRTEVAATEKEIEKLRAEFSLLYKQRKELEASIVSHKQDDQRLVKKISLLAKESEKQQLKVKDSEEHLITERKKLQKRLKALYTSSSASVSPLLMWKVHGPELERFAVYVRAVRSGDEVRFSVVKSAVEELIAQKQRLEDAMSEGRRLQAEVASKRADVEVKLTALRGVAEQIVAKQKAAQRSLVKLHGESERLQALMAAMTGGNDTNPAVDSSLPQGNAKVPAERAITGDVAGATAENGRTSGESVAVPVGLAGGVVPPASLAPQGLFTAGVSLVSPVVGKVLQHYGKVKVTEFSDMIFSKGVEFSSPVGTTVHAVLQGRVAFIGSMPAYETVVVLDHGARSYSLYGRLGSSSVQKGQMLAMDAVVGVTSALDKKGRNFYFEVRRNGAPIDPQGVLKKFSR